MLCDGWVAGLDILCPARTIEISRPAQIRKGIISVCSVENRIPCGRDVTGSAC
jgi:hypothetical protein